MSNKNSDTEKDHATIVSSHFYIYVIKLPLSCRPWNSALYMGYQVSSDLWTIFKNYLCEKRRYWKVLHVSWWVCIVNHGLVGIVYLWLKKNANGSLLKIDEWKQSHLGLSIRLAFAGIDHMSKRPGQWRRGKKGEEKTRLFSPSSLGLYIASAKRSQTWWSRQHEHCYICLSLFLCFFISLSAVSCEMDESCHAPLPLFSPSWKMSSNL